MRVMCAEQCACNVCSAMCVKCACNVCSAMCVQCVLYLYVCAGRPRLLYIGFVHWFYMCVIYSKCALAVHLQAERGIYVY